MTGPSAGTAAALERQATELIALRGRVAAMGAHAPGVPPEWSGLAQQAFADRLDELRSHLRRAEDALDEAIGETRRAVSTIAGRGG